MITYPAPRITPERAYIARMAIETGATLYAIGATRRQAQHRLVAALESRYAAHYAREQAVTALTQHPED